ncbi:MAG: DUF3134 domain-containing protein [Plectolyngbya sp. WJT66-NPBG17]|jgi:arsenate reductase-like glutaredoxin family protein|nr:DUF3134 domain-containing protein [Plectolyngbya sp. WJT66-NPBG17]
MIHNPSLRQETRTSRAAIIPMQQESSILDWLESSGRLLARDNADFDYLDDEEEINELMENDGGTFDTDDDDDDLDPED